MKYAKWLRRKRLEHDYSQSFVANYLQVSRETVAGWEHRRARPNYECLQKIFKLYKCSNEEIAHFINLPDDTSIK